MRGLLVIDRGAAVRNWQRLAQRHGAEVAAVVKADAYGLGTAEMAPALQGAGCRSFFVATPDEGEALRRILGAGPLIAVLDGCTPTEAAASALTPVLNSLADLAAHAGRGMLHLDTGMARLGLPPEEIDAATGFDPPWVMNHLIAAEEAANPLNAMQRQRFTEYAARFPRAKRSFANSSGIFLGSGFASDLARPGAALWGLNPTLGEPNPMERVVRLALPILQLREIPAGASVGYGASWVAPRPSRIATVAGGYADGLPRSAWPTGWGEIGGRRVALVGRVSMDLATFDVTDAPEARPGAMIALPEPDALAEAAGTIGYEILTRLGHRFERRYGEA
jgi:alanine racemase